jgi:hypothetical protein
MDAEPPALASGSLREARMRKAIPELSMNSISERSGCIAELRARTVSKRLGGLVASSELLASVSSLLSQTTPTLEHVAERMKTWTRAFPGLINMRDAGSSQIGHA